MYSYAIRTIAYVEVQSKDDSGNNILAVGFLVSSKKSTATKVLCEEYVPPPVPSDIAHVWDFKEKCLRLSWSFPPNPQRDIKKFQIFRRRTTHEPFELIQMYDFDDSVIKSPYHETPDLSLVKVSKIPNLSFYDKEFTKDSRYIYALCSIDAHGFSSPYSIQMELSFDRFKNKLKKKLISIAGSPKIYPNAFINMDTFVDSIKDEGHSKMKVVFNPEYLKLLSSQGQDLELLKTGANDTYKIQLINADLQKQEIININLIDRTTEASVLKRIDSNNDVHGNQPIEKFV